ncbi:uncharacterized protein LOC125648793 [Ostrea edulis]|uniref:uncharacterized protein LOC125648793 n=1 Tax=Ostrea edulis TaxID=37623 RepID=UPI0024AF1C1F|nr:uncharacterized protein LOC125648793 [Ostrea edulis]
MASFGGLDLIAIFLIPLVIHINFAIALDCYRGSPCCILWNEDLNICSDCKSGYIGENCDLPCRYPSYGVDCQLECNCNESYCNHKHGCRAIRDRPGEAQAESKQKNSVQRKRGKSLTEIGSVCVENNTASPPPPHTTPRFRTVTVPVQSLFSSIIITEI